MRLRPKMKRFVMLLLVVSAPRLLAEGTQQKAPQLSSWSRSNKSRQGKKIQVELFADKIVNGEMEAWVANTLKRSVDARERVIA
jgi:hypothetical protein